MISASGLLRALGLALALTWLIWCAFVLPQDTPPIAIAMVGVLALFVSSGLDRGPQAK